MQMMLEPIVLPSGYCFACNSQPGSMVCGYHGKCPFCGSAGELDDLRATVDSQEQEITALEDEVSKLKKQLELFKHPTFDPEYDDATEMWAAPIPPFGKYK